MFACSSHSRVPTLRTSADAVQRERAEAFQGKTALLPECRYARVEQEARRSGVELLYFIGTVMTYLSPLRSFVILSKLTLFGNA